MSKKKRRLGSYGHVTYSREVSKHMLMTERVTHMPHIIRSSFDNNSDLKSPEIK